MIGGPNLRYVRVEPPLAQCTSTTAVTQFTILLSSGVHVQSGLRDSGTLIYTPYYIFLSSPPPDGPSSGTESNLPVSHSTPGIQIVDFADSRQLFTSPFIFCFLFGGPRYDTYMLHRKGDIVAIFFLRLRS